MFALKPFQEKALTDLRSVFLNLWKREESQLPLVFQSPTGSGKTIMTAQFLKDLTGDPQFQADKAFLWISFSPDSYQQSKDKLYKYYGGAGELNLLDMNDLSQGKLYNNDVFFINWQKVVSKAKENRKLRSENEQGVWFDRFIEATKSAGRELVLLVDEAHTHSSTALAQEIIDLIDPRIIIKITATPQDTDVVQAAKLGSYVQVDREAVVEQGLIKEKLIFQTEDEVKKLTSKHISKDEVLLKLAVQKRAELEVGYQEAQTSVKPLVLIQLPNDYKETKVVEVDSKEALVRQFLSEQGVLDHQIATWLSGRQENLDGIERHDSPIEYLIFKQAAATGWDCPRASILVMFREIKNPTFQIQTIGRILRMPEAKHYSLPLLNSAYIYTDYERNTIIDGYDRDANASSLPSWNRIERKSDIEPITLTSHDLSRTDYNDLGDSFQHTFLEQAHSFFGTTDKTKPATVLKQLKEQGLAVDGVHQDIIVNLEIEDYDNYLENLQAHGVTASTELTETDVERIYNLLCYDIVAKQDEEKAKYAPARSWGKLKTALNVWLGTATKLSRSEIYAMVVNDLSRPASVLRPLVTKSFIAYRPVRDGEVIKKQERQQTVRTLELPPQTLFVSDGIKKKYQKSAMEPVLTPDHMPDNEKKFIDFLEDHAKVQWWYKNGDKGTEHFALPYTHNGKQNLFYLDWIIKTKSSLWIIDTKSGMTAKDAETKAKAESLQQWLKTQTGIEGGIVRPADGWFIHRGKKYAYELENGWEDLNKVLV
jgi:type III restriction enzyme